MKRLQQFLFDTGLAHHRAGRLQKAEHDYREALAFDEQEPLVLNMLGVVMHQCGRNPQALEFLQKSLSAKPTADAYANLGNIYKFTGQLGEAVNAYEKAIALDPNSFAAHANLGGALERLSLHAEALKSYNRAISLDPRNSAIHSNALALLNHMESADREEIFEQHLRWATAHTLGAPPIGVNRNTREPQRILRVGYVSADFRCHSAANFIEPILTAHDRKKVQVYCYSNVLMPDAISKRIAALPLTFRPIYGLSDEQAAKLIHGDVIDILVDLSGHGSGGRLPMFARRPAPIQMSYLGYPNTTGMKAIDYRITDAISDPPNDADKYYTEKLLRLPSSAWCFQPPVDAPPVAGLPALEHGHITFGSFNNFAKITPAVLEVWAKVLAAVPKSRLLLKADAFSLGSVQERILAVFATQNIAPERIEFSPAGLEYKAHLALYGRVDVALDPFPCNGAATTLEALFMGVPVLTLKGKSHAGRVGMSLLAQINMPEWIANSTKGYVRRSYLFTRDLQELVALRAQLRFQLLNCGITDAPTFVAHLESAYRAAWQAWARVVSF